MRPRSARLPAALWLVGLALAVAATAVPSALADTTTQRIGLVVQAMAMTALGLVGLLVARRRPDNSIGWLFLGLWLYYAVFASITAWAQWQQLDDPDPTGHTVATWLVNWLWVPMFGCVVLYPAQLFPTGRPLSRRWRPLVPVGAAVIALWTASFALQPSQYGDAFGHEIRSGNPYGVTGLHGLFDTLPFLLAVAFLALTLAALASLVVRFVRGDDVVRAQLKWVLAAGLLWVPFLLYPGDHGAGGLIDIWAGVALAALPVACGVAILRYRLYDIDRIISRTTSYAIVTGLLLGAYALVVTSVTRLLPSSNTFAVAAATLTAAAMARPLLRRVQSAVDHRFNRAHFEAATTIDAYGHSLRHETDSDAIARGLTDVVARTLQPSTVGLWLTR